MATHVPCKKNDANGYVFYVSLVSQANTKIFQANPTYAAGDIKVAVDDGAPANVSAVAIDGDFTKRVKITLSQAQTNGDNLTVICSDAAGDEWCDLTINIQTSAQTLDEMDTVVDAIKAETALIVADTNELQVDDYPTSIAAIKAETALIVADTNELQADDYPTSIAAVKTDTAAILVDTAVIGALGAGLSAVPWNAAWAAEVQSECADALTAYDPPTKTEMDTAHALLATPAQVNTEVVDAIGTDTISELAQATPTATPTVKTALMLLYMIARNKLTTTSTELGVYNDAGTKIIKKTLADDGSTYTETEMGSGA